MFCKKWNEFEQSKAILDSVLCIKIQLKVNIWKTAFLFIFYFHSVVILFHIVTFYHAGYTLFSWPFLLGVTSADHSLNSLLWNRHYNTLAFASYWLWNIVTVYPIKLVVSFWTVRGNPRKDWENVPTPFYTFMLWDDGAVYLIPVPLCCIHFYLTSTNLSSEAYFIWLQSSL